MIFSVDPEDWHGWHAVFLADARRQLDGRDGFQECEQGAAEQAGLLTGHDRDGGGVTQALGRGACLWRGPPECLLGEDRIGDGVAATCVRVRLHLADDLSPRLWFGRVAGEKRTYPVEGVGIVHGQFPEARVLPDVDRLADCCRMSGILLLWHRGLLSQSLPRVSSLAPRLAWRSRGPQRVPPDAHSVVASRNACNKRTWIPIPQIAR